MTKRNVSILLVLIVAVGAWVFARPNASDLKTTQPQTLFEQALADHKPVFIMFTSDT